MSDIRFIAWAGYQLAPCSGGLAEDASFIIWNGLGPNDGGGDWSRTGYGIESILAKHSGTNGLDASNMSKGSKIFFNGQIGRYQSVDNWDFLRIWVNIRDWQNHNKMLFVKLHVVDNLHNNSISLINLNDYVSTSQIGGWQKAMIPLKSFNFRPDRNYEIQKVELESDGQIGLWLDDLALIAGTMETLTVPICSPDMNSNEIGAPGIVSREIRPGLRSFPQPNTTISNPSGNPYPKRYL